MADNPTPPTVEPTELTVGNTWEWTRDFSDYPASDWTLVYYLTPTNGSVITITATADGDTHEVSVPASTTSGYAAGSYLFTGFVNDGVDRFEVYRSTITVKANPTTAHTWKSYAQQMLDLIESTLSGAVARRDISYSINGRSFTAKTDSDLIKARNYFRAEVQHEASAGKNRKIVGRFVSAR